jgi:hypothetical protein
MVRTATKKNGQIRMAPDTIMKVVIIYESGGSKVCCVEDFRGLVCPGVEGRMIHKNPADNLCT